MADYDVYGIHGDMILYNYHNNHVQRQLTADILAARYVYCQFWTFTSYNDRHVEKEAVSILYRERERVDIVCKYTQRT